MNEQDDILASTPQHPTNEEPVLPKAMEALVFEEMIYELLEYLDFTDITRPEGKDRGFDYQAIYPYKSPTGIVTQQRWIIVIEYHRNFKIELRDLEQLLGYLQMNQADKALFITNTTLTSFAKELVARVNREAEQKLEVWDGEQLLALFARFPELQGRLGTLILQFINNQTTTTQRSLAEQLAKCQPGQQDWRKYEEICITVLNEVFIPPLKSVVSQARTENGLERRDALLPLLGAKEGWEEISQKYDAHFLLCEFKNYADPIGKDEVNQAATYLKGHIGRLGIIFSRVPPSPSALNMRRSIYADSHKLILFFEDKHLLELLKLKEAHQNPLQLIQDAILDFLLGYE